MTGLSITGVAFLLQAEEEIDLQTFELQEKPLNV